MKKLVALFCAVIMCFTLDVCAQVEKSYAFEFYAGGGGEVIKKSFDIFSIIGSESYSVIDGVNDTVYADDECKIKCVGGTLLAIYQIEDNVSFEQGFVGNTWQVNSKGDKIIISNQIDGYSDVCDLGYGTYMIEMQVGGSYCYCRLVVGNGVYGSKVNVENSASSDCEDGTSIIRVLKVRNSIETWNNLEAEIVYEIEVNEDNVARVVKDVLINDYAFDVLDVTYNTGVLTINYAESQCNIRNAGSSAASMYRTQIQETIFPCDFIQVINEQLEGEHVYGLAHYSFEPIYRNEYRYCKITNMNYSKMLPEKAFFDYYQRNFNEDYERKKYKKPYLADLNGDMIPELLVRDDMGYSYIDIYEYINGEIIEREPSISQSYGTGVNDDYYILIMDDGSIKLLNSYFCHNGMIGEYAFSSKNYYVYEWGNESPKTELTYEEFDNLREEYAVATSEYRENTSVYNLFNDDALTEYEKFEYIWNEQCSKYAASIDNKNYVILKINSNVMNTNGDMKFIDTDKSTVPVLDNGRTLVPLRAVSEALGAEISWDNDSQTAIATLDGVTVRVPVGSNTIYKDNSPITIDVPAKIMNSRTYVPIRAITEAFGCDVEWNNESRTVEITS